MSGSEDEDFSENSSIRRQNVRRILSETRTMPEFSNSDESEMDYESAEENLVEVENNQPMENPQIEIGSNIVALENDQLKVTFSRIQLKRNLKFKLTDIHYSIKRKWGKYLTKGESSFNHSRFGICNSKYQRKIFTRLG